VGITTHVLDTSLGRPAAAVHVTLEHQTPAGEWRVVGSGDTDADGRLNTLVSGTAAAAGIHRLIFDTKSYFDRRGVAGFYPSVTVTFEVQGGGGHYHVPLLLSPFGYSTYRGS
jgi:5-hydroxyisourate hydrolase